MIGDNATNLTNHEDAYKQHIEEDTFANLTTFATTAVNGIMCFASDTKQYFFVKDTELVPLGGGGNTYKSTWDAATNTPTLPTGADNNGDYYIVSVAGSQDLGNGLVDWDVNDFALFNDVTGFEKIDNTNKVESVNGKEGIVVLDADDIASTATRYWDIKHNRTAIAEPTVGDDDTLNYSVGSRWLIPADEVELICLDATTGAAVWEQISGSGAGKLSIWGSVKAESNKLKNWTTVGTGTLVVQEVEIASGKSSYELGINALGDGAIYETTATSGAIDVITNGLQYIYKTALTNMLVEILDGNDDSVMEDFVMDEHTDWQYIKELFNFANTFVGPTIKIKMTSTDATTGVVFFDQLELDSDPNTMGNAVESTSSRLSSGGTPSLNVAIPVFTNLGSNLDNEFYTIVSDGTDGTSITFKTSCLVSMSYQDSFLSGTYMGFSKNSVNLSTGFFQIPQSEKITGTYQGTSTTLATATISDYPVVAGDVIRPHADNINSYNAGEQRILNITATANSQLTFFEGSTVNDNVGKAIWTNPATGSWSVTGTSFVQPTNWAGKPSASIVGKPVSVDNVDTKPHVAISRRKGIHKFTVQGVWKIGGNGGYSHGIRFTNGVIYTDIATLSVSAGNGTNLECLLDSNEEVENEKWYMEIRSSGSDTVYFPTTYVGSVGSITVTTPDDTKIAATGANIPAEDQEKILSATVTSSTDVSELTITGLTIGEDYNLGGQIAMSSSNGADVNCRFYSEALGFGTLYGRTRIRGRDTSIDSTIHGINTDFTAQTETLYVRYATTSAANGQLTGDGTKNATFIQVTKRPKGNYYGKFNRANYIYDSVERLAGYQSGGKDVYYRGYILGAGSYTVDTIDVGLVPIGTWGTLIAGLYHQKDMVQSAGTSSSQAFIRYGYTTGVLSVSVSAFTLDARPFEFFYIKP